VRNESAGNPASGNKGHPLRFCLWLLIALFVGVTWKFERGAAFLFLPYILWVSFAAALNYTV
jgi:tryptophan-rich sensory protein